MALLTELGIIELTVTPASLEDMFLREYQGASSMSTTTVAPRAGRHEAPTGSRRGPGVGSLLRLALRRDRVRLSRVGRPR